VQPLIAVANIETFLDLENIFKGNAHLFYSVAINPFILLDLP